MVREPGVLYEGEGSRESTWTNGLRVQGRYMGGVGALEPIGRTRGSGREGGTIWERPTFSRKRGGEIQHYIKSLLLTLFLTLPIIRLSFQSPGLKLCLFLWGQ